MTAHPETLAEPKPLKGFLDTGISELNDLLTRNPKSGIAWPGTDKHPSSTMVIRGSAGTGKSIFCALLARNFHLKPKQINREDGTLETIIPFCVYFSYSQSARGLYFNMKDILTGQDKDLEKRFEESPNPLLLSPRSTGRISSTNGIEMLRRSLLNELTPLFEPQFADKVELAKRVATLRRYIDSFRNSEDWEVGGNPGLEIKDTSDHPGPVKIAPIVFVDPINFLFDRADSRDAISKLIDVFRLLQWPLIATIEDGGPASDEVHRQLVSYIEFETDVIIELGTTPPPYVTRTIQVRKNRNSQARLGSQFYRIERPGHAFWNIPWSWNRLTRKELLEQKPEGLDYNQRLRDDAHPGFMLYPSIHWFLSKVRHRHHFRDKRRSTGSQSLDKLLNGPSPGEQTKLAIPPDAFILIRGEKGGHKLTLGFNLLVAALWSERPELIDKVAVDGRPIEVKVASESRTAMLLSMGEEIHYGVPRIALSRMNARSIKLDPASDPISLPRPPASRPLSHTSDDKVEVRIWCQHDRDSKPDWEVLLKPDTPKVVEVKFKPGLLTPEEFLWVVSSLTKLFQPARMMLENTAHLHTRFPDLAKEKMLFQALNSLAQDRNIIFIVNDIIAKGSDPQLSLGLAASADYILNVSQFDRHERETLWRQQKVINERHPERPLLFGAQGGTEHRTQTKLEVTNIRGKKYINNTYAVWIRESAEGIPGGKGEFGITDVSPEIWEAAWMPSKTSIATTPE